MLCPRVIAVCLFACLGSINLKSPLLAQITPDNTLGNESSIVAPQDEALDLIEGGAIRGDNLFHSFEQFNIENGNAVYFNNPDGIANILTRVTGNNISEIFGTLGVDGNANLFLLNPNGIVFGENAALDLNGSFLATTADSYIFNNDFKYSGTNPELPPLLTVNIPVGLQMGNNSAAIEVKSTGSNLILGELGLIRDERTRGLEVKAENTLGLLGGEINLTGGNLTAESGNIELGSVAAGTVTITSQEYGFDLGYEAITEFQDINLTQASSLDTSGKGGGRFQLSGKNISLLEESLIVNNTLGSSNGRNSQIVATNTIKLLGTEIGTLPTGIVQFVEPGATGNSGEITLKTGKLEIVQNAFILNGVTGDGNGGDLNIAASTIEIDRDPATQHYGTGLFTEVLLGTGKGGDLTLNGDRLIVKGGGIVSSTTFAEGNGGDSNINVPQTEIIGSTADGLFPSILFSTADGTGNAGNLTINGDRLIVKDGAQIGSGTFGAGDGGNSIINVAQIEIIGTAADNSFSSGLFSSSDGTGSAGNLAINGDRLIVKDGGQIDSGTFGAGDGGNSTINVAQIEIIGTAANELFSSGLFSSSEGTGSAGNLNIKSNSISVKDGGSISSSTADTGNAGDVDIEAKNIEVIGTSNNGDFLSEIVAVSKANSPAGFLEIVTNKLSVTDGAEIAVSNTGFGDAGNLTITASEINLDRNGNLRAEVNQGKRGNINLITDNLLLDNNSRIDAQAFNDATGGNISIDNSANIVLQNNSQINASAKQGNGGNIAINTQGYFISANSLVIASSELGLDGNVEVEISNGDRPIELNSLPENPTDATEQITTGCGINNNFAIAGKGGLPDNPTQDLRGQTIWQDLRLPKQIIDRSASMFQYPTEKNSVVEAQSWKINSQGNIELVNSLNIGEDAILTLSNFNCI